MQGKSGSLLVVDDDKTFLSLSEMLFSKYFIVKTANSAEIALGVLSGGFTPDVILADQVMNGMSGADFLEKSINLVPNAVRILISGHSSSAETVGWIKKAQAFMSLSKPCPDLELVQAVRIGIEHSRLKARNLEVTKLFAASSKELKEKNEQLKRYIYESRTLASQALQSLSGLIHVHEKLYFTPHTHNVSLIAKSIADRMMLEQEAVSNVITASLLQGAATAGMPMKFLANDPSDLTDNEVVDYFEYFDRGISSIKKISNFSKAVAIIKQIWEHYDGSGLPYGLASTYIQKESQIIAICNIYHNRTYRVPAEKLEQLATTGALIQTKDETQERHNEALRFINKRSSWFDVDIYNTFLTIVKKRAIPAVFPLQHDLVVEFDGVSINNQKEKSVSAEIPTSQGSNSISIDFSQEDEKKKIEKDIPVSNLQSGMIVAQNIVTRGGMLIVRQDNVLDSNLIRNLQHLERTGMLTGEITILVEE